MNCRIKREKRAIKKGKRRAPRSVQNVASELSWEPLKSETKSEMGCYKLLKSEKAETRSYRSVPCPRSENELLGVNSAISNNEVKMISENENKMNGSKCLNSKNKLKLKNWVILVSPAVQKNATNSGFLQNMGR